MIKKYRYQFLLVLFIIIGAVFVQSLINSYNTSIEKESVEKLNKVHSNAVLRAQAGIEVYATLVSSLRAYINNSREFPSEIRFQNYLKDLIKDLNFNDSIVINYIDTNQEFKYVFTPQKIDPAKLKGLNAKDFRPKNEMDKLDELMYSDSISLFTPINLREGWAGFPFNFAAKNSEGEILGYIAPILNVKYLLNYFYKLNGQNEFAHRFIVNDSVDITREVVYDGTEIFNTKRDSSYYKNHTIKPGNFIYSNLDLYGLNLKLGSALIDEKPSYNYVSTLTYLWYSFLSIFSFIALFQFSKNVRLSKNLLVANTEIKSKNEKLEFSLLKIQTLIKEIHHRVKNNMQMIANLLTLQEDEYDSPQVKAALNQTKNRIHSMSLIHEKLYGSANLENINTKEYIEQLIAFIEATISDPSMLPKKHFSIPEDLIFDAETMNSLGLIINELITNSYKYAFKSNNENVLEVTITKSENDYTLIYSDSGPGLPDGFNLEASESLGMQLIHIFTEQLKGSVTYANTTKSTFTIQFKEAEELA